MEGLTNTPQQPEVNAIQPEREGLALRERERRLEDANHLIGVIHIETIQIKHRDDMLVALSQKGITTIDEDLNNILKMNVVGVEQIIKPTSPNVDKILANIRLLEKFGEGFGYDQGGQADRMRDLVSRIRLSTNEEEAKKLTEQAKEIFFNNVSGLLKDRYGITEQQDKVGTICKSNGRQLQDNLEGSRFRGEERKMIIEGPVGHFVERSFNYGNGETTLVEESLEYDYRYRKNITNARDEFAQVVDTLAPKK